ncbi:DUF2306 domain-containing protein [Parafrankia soli]|uniref:DUF2306 domain-containing protein n=1 Tax=Parafrankia soli TaxID=2599596 RepID=UPI003B58A671
MGSPGAAGLPGRRAVAGSSAAVSSVVSSGRASWLVPAGLLLLSAVPVAAGALRVGDLAGGARATAENARFVAQPVPVVVHIIGASLYSVLGAFQFSPGLRRRAPRWHRATGRLLIPCGLAVAFTGVWMTLFYDLPPADGVVLAGLRIIVGTVMGSAVILGVVAVRRGDIARHRAWMTRAYALALGAGTQLFTHLPYEIAVGKPGEASRAVLMAAGWLINVVVAERIIRARPPGGRRTAAGPPGRRGRGRGTAAD